MRAPQATVKNLLVSLALFATNLGAVMSPVDVIVVVFNVPLILQFPL